MSQAVNINFRMDADLKRNMEQVCKDMGMSMTTAFTIFAKTVTREKRIPFDVTAESSYNAATIAALQEARMLACDPAAPRYGNVEEALQELKK